MSNINQWQLIETAPTDNKRLLYLARFDEEGKLRELDFDGVWERWQESWELSHINGYAWFSANGIEDPTHWAYQDEPIPAAALPTLSQQSTDRSNLWYPDDSGDWVEVGCVRPYLDDDVMIEIMLADDRTRQDWSSYPLTTGYCNDWSSIVAYKILKD